MFFPQPLATLTRAVIPFCRRRQRGRVCSTQRSVNAFVCARLFHHSFFAIFTLFSCVAADSVQLFSGIVAVDLSGLLSFDFPQFKSEYAHNLPYPNKSTPHSTNIQHKAYSSRTCLEKSHFVFFLIQDRI